MSRWLRWLVICTLVFAPSAFAFAQTATPAPTATPDYRTYIPVGFIQMSAAPSAPSGWLVADGSCVSRTTYANLLNVYGTSYGHCDGVTTFGLPDLRGRVMVAQGQGDGLTDHYLGFTGGDETHTLTVTEMPSHNHVVTDPGHSHIIINRNGVATNRHSGVGGANPSNAENAPGTTNSGTANVTTGAMTGITVNSTGGGEAFSIMQPYFVLNFYIWSGVVALPVASSPSDIDLTVVVVFPTHTPTPTLTPSMTPTAGPSPTATATVTPTPDFISYSTYSGQDAALVYQLTAGDFAIILLLGAVLCALMVIIFMKHREGANDVG